MRPFIIIFSGQAFNLWNTPSTNCASMAPNISDRISKSINSRQHRSYSTSGVYRALCSALVDRWNRRRVKFSDSLIAGAILILYVLFAFQRVEMWQIYLVMLFRWAGRSLSMTCNAGINKHDGPKT